MNTYLSLLQRNANYRNLWFARVVSNLGDWFNILACAALIARLTNAGTAISLLFLVRFLPLFFMSPFAGVIADHFDRRKVLIVTDVSRAAIVASFLFVDRPERIWLLYVLTALQFVFSAVFTPAQTALVPNIVAEDDLVSANALDSMTWSTMLAIGAMLGGLATAFLGVISAFILDSLSFLLSAWFVSRMHVPAAAHAIASTAPTVRAGILAFVEGMRYLLGQPLILTIALVKAGAALVWGALNVIEIPLAEKLFPLNGSGTLTLGLIYFAVGLGTGFGPLLLRSWSGDTKPAMLRNILIGFAALAVGIIGLAVAPALPWVLAATTVRSVGSGAVWVFSTVILQEILPDYVRGRVFAFEFAALTLTQSFGTLWAGYAYDAQGMSVQAIFAVSAVVCTVVGLVWAGCYLYMRGRPLVSPS